MNNELKEKLNEAARAAEEFTKLYYKHVDTKRHGVNKFYMDDGLLVYNGNGFTGQIAITKFLTELPETKHELTTIDAQPILDMDTTPGSTFPTLLIQVSGTVKIAGQKSRAFQQTFTLAVDPTKTKWKIVTDTFRLQDGICGEIKI